MKPIFFMKKHQSLQSLPLSICKILLLSAVFPLFSFADDSIENKIKEKGRQITNQAGSANNTNAASVINKAESSKGQTLPHPWPGGVNPQWENDWKNDSRKAVSADFMKCFEPRLIKGTCDFCKPASYRKFISEASCPKQRNTGEVWEYWWPEAEVELNAFGISAINTKLAGVEDLDRNGLKRALIEQFKPELAKRFLEQLGVDVNVEEFDDLSASPLFGHNATSDLGTSKNVSTEAHIYQTSVDKYGQDERPGYASTEEMQAKLVWDPETQTWKCKPTKPIALNGYKKINKCFYNALNEPSENIIHGWTEESGIIDYWRFPERSDFIRSDLYQQARVAPQASSISDYLNELKKESGITNAMKWLRNDTCASFRLTNFPDRFSSLNSLFKIEKRPYNLDSDPLKYQCYMEAELYPLTGSLPGAHPPHTSSAYLARKAIELISYRRDVLAGEKRRTPLTHFADWSESPRAGLDKLQFVYPRAVNSSCFQMKDVSEDSSFFNNMKFNPDSTGSVRLIIWNKRIACSCSLRGYLDPNSSLTSSAQLAINDEEPTSNAYGCISYPCNPDSDSSCIDDHISHGDERIGNGDLPTGHPDAKIFSDKYEEGYFPKPAQQLFPFGH